MTKWFFMFILLWVATAFGHTPDGLDTALDPWIQGLKQPGVNGASCCSNKDCNLARGVKIVDGIYWVLDSVDNQMIHVDPGVILRNVNNQAGDYLVCIHNGKVLCFVLPTGT